MTKNALLVLEDGSIYRGYGFGAERPTYGEVVFTTSMTGYQEMLTDPSYNGQVVVTTYPLVGNYGIDERVSESGKIQASGFVVREHCLEPSHSLSTMSLNDFLSSQNIPGISGVDTRAITRRIRTHGVMMGAIAINEQPDDVLKRLLKEPRYGDIDYVAQVSTQHPYRWKEPESVEEPNRGKTRILISDCGLKYNIMRILKSRGCDVVAMPSTATAEDFLSHSPDGVVFSPGPGDPELLNYAVDTAKGLIDKMPILGICLGNQMLARAFGGKTFKLKFGHRGANHPVRDLSNGLVYITSQNHGYAIDPDSLPSDVQVSHINLNDGTVEGIRHVSLPVMGIQYHSEASPGPHDNEYVFDKFLELVRGAS